jgi:hypothetical protein
MADRDIFIEGVQLEENGEEEFFAEGVQFDEDQAAAPAGGNALNYGSMSLMGCGI